MTAAAEGPAAAVTQSPAPSPDGAAPRLADGIEFIGEYEGSGLEDAPYVVKRADGQLVQMPELLFRVAEQVDGVKCYDAIAREVTRRSGTELGEGDVKVLVDDKLGELGLLAGSAPADAAEKREDPLLALKLKTAVLPSWLMRAATTIFYPAFFPIVIIGVVGALIVLDAWLFTTHGVAQSFRHLLNEPATLLLVLGCMVLGTFFHEIGHATACRYGGAEPGVMGVGIYLIWPAFYTDVNDAYRLGRGGRIRTDLGGVYFNSIFCLAIAGVYFLTGFEPLLLVIIGQHMQMFQQFMPFVRLDGYYVVSDITGVPDLFARIGPIIRSAIPGRDKDPKVQELKPWVRKVVSAWVFLTIPAIVLLYALMIVHVPRLISTGLVSFRRHASEFSQAMADGSLSGAGSAAVQVVMLVLPTVGATYVLVRTAKRLGTALWNKTSSRPAARTALGFATGLAMIATVVAVWPDADYRPIRRDERGTLAEATRTLARKTSNVTPTSTRSSPAPEGSATPLPGSSDERRDERPADASQDVTSGSGDDPAEQPTTAPDGDPSDVTPGPTATATPTATPAPAQ